MKKRVCVISGGYSGEAVISMRSAQMVLENADRSRFEVYQALLDKTGWWVLHNNQQYAINLSDFSVDVEGTRLAFDLACIMIHGTPGEDGRLQGYFDMIGLPYTTGGVLNMALTFNKSYTTRTLGAMGFKVARSLMVDELPTSTEFLLSSGLGLPVFVKPNEGGSSLGASKVSKADELLPAISKALAADKAALIEEFITGTEFTCGCISENGKPRALHITEIESSKSFFDFEAKYNYDQTREITPARLVDDRYRECQQLTERIYEALNCRGVIRVDFILNQAGFYVIEVNTVPGMTSKSIVPQQARAMGITDTELVTRIFESASLPG